jgi:GNAT superfamily N-acetyltransferase
LIIGRLSIRIAIAEERGALEDLMRRASLANPGDRQALLENPDAIDLPVQQIEAGLVFVAETQGNTLGFAALLPRDDGDVELDGLFVEPRSWRRGVGRALVDHCAAWARASGATTMHVIGNYHAEGFYHRCGFETVGPYLTRFAPALRMTKAL